MADNSPTGDAALEWRAEDIPDEYGPDDSIMYTCATTDPNKPVFYFDSNGPAEQLAELLNTQARQLRQETRRYREALDSIVELVDLHRNEAVDCECGLPDALQDIAGNALDALNRTGGDDA